jgi:beta-fructofuranosidase
VLQNDGRAGRRPQFHFAPERGWINDPHGIVHREGRYHVFYQFVPESTVWAANCHWGHATGVDLLSLKAGPIALAPGDGDGGIWTGSVVEDAAHGARIFYTSTSEPDLAIGRVRSATPADADWTEWHKGPVVVEPPHAEVTSFRDPFVLWDNDRWRMLVGAAFVDGAAGLVGYQSHDLETWTSSGVVASRSSENREGVWTGTLWECPQLFEMGGLHVLVVSVWDDGVLHHVAYATGEFHDGIFSASAWSQLTFGDSYYAPSYFVDSEGQPSLMFWLRGVGDEDAGWSGALSVGHRLSLVGSQLVATPIGLLDCRREAVSGPTSNAMDIEWRPSGSGQRLTLDGSALVFQLSTNGAELTLEIPGRDVHSMPYEAGDSVRCIVDGPILEISCSTGVMASAIVRHEGERLHAAGQLDAWHLRNDSTKRENL